ncbi:hypothetical protein PR048_002608 [Dryococelus australis]|uniref:Mutator-like transposase domain-containing protein n=1 Tax=Dryococelus australis TaxID=614101 RepID=A0ABQ9ILD8_9NEOP|nr:hypothetical protein PR048_002608 [Dryococelus australis]
MEQDIIVDGFVQIMNMHGIKYNKLIGDGDSSVHRKLIDATPYGPDMQVQKIECRNHVLRNYMNKVRDICGKTRLGNLQLRTILQTQAQHLRTAVVSAIKYRKDQKSFISNYERTEELRKDAFKSPYHVFGNHDKCVDRDYFGGAKSKHGETDLVPQLKEAGIWRGPLIPVQRVATHATSLILDVDTNISETFNSVVAKTVGGKRANFALRNSYQTKWEAAVVSINSQGFAEQNNLNVDTCRLLVDEDSPFLGASLDGLIGDDAIIQVKCPASIKLLTPTEAREYCHFVVWSPMGMVCDMIKKGYEYWSKKVFPKIFNCLLPQIIDSRYARKSPIREPEYIMKAQESLSENKEARQAYRSAGFILARFSECRRHLLQGSSIQTTCDRGGCVAVYEGKCARPE